MKAPNAYSKWSYIPNELLRLSPSPEDASEFDEIYAAILAQKNRASKHAPSVVGDFLAWNTSGTNPPLFWCFNSWAEPFLLARHLDNNQPLYAMSSFSGATDNWRLKTKYMEPLARRYIESVKKVKGISPLLMGGNCQGAPIAESMAIQILENSVNSPYLLSIDYIGKRPYRGKRLMLFGRKSGFNPFLSERNPIDFWEERHAQFSWDFLEGKHGSYFLEPNVEILAEFIAEKSREAALGSKSQFRLFLDRVRSRLRTHCL
ncbi:hypothetical protein [Pseudophaeobacter sp.]|uniref:hypothetical protein n=1 Tax=Pseudophaeobacter sp. TaxID=1971739 RepID=UPI003299453A